MFCLACALNCIYLTQILSLIIDGRRLDFDKSSWNKSLDNKIDHVSLVVGSVKKKSILCFCSDVDLILVLCQNCIRTNYIYIILFIKHFKILDINGVQIWLHDDLDFDRWVNIALA